ncbi:MAG TPA: chorismate mutase [Alkalispirochaeta sp.]|nr:chorismate mutase [Alkalispirochaeta sp.]
MKDQTDAPQELTTYRETLDRLDASLIYLLAERFSVTEAIGHLKAERDLPALDAQREDQQLSRLQEIAESAGLPSEYAQGVFRTITTMVRERHEEIRRNTGNQS